MQTRAFADRFLEHLDKIDPAEIEAFIRRTVRERNFTARIFETLIEGVVVLDSDLKVTLLNAAARRMLRLSTGRKITGENILPLIPEGDLRELIKDFSDNPRPIRDKETILQPGSDKVHNVHLLPLLPDKNESKTATDEGAALVMQDLTSPLTRQQRDSQARTMESLATLTAGVAHDIKNPLNSLSIHAQLLSRTMKDFQQQADGKNAKSVERIQQSCKIISEEVQRLRQCVDDFIDAARPRQPRLRVDNLNKIVQAVGDMARLELESHGIELHISLDPDMPPLSLDERQIQHCLRNLIRNGIEAIEAANAPADRRIVLRTSAMDEKVALEITDTGTGITKENLTKIFEPYFTTKFSGSGLGLLAVAGIVREHGAEIHVNSTPGEGTAFTIEFPVLSRQVRLLEEQ